MELANHDMGSLFEQLGLDNSENAIDHFIKEHRPLKKIQLHEATFWNRSQSLFLKEAIANDAEWAIVVDQLDSMLR